MLRVRPTLTTTDTERMSALLIALGLRQAEKTDDQTLFDAGGGRIALCEDTAGLDVIGFEAGNLTEFTRRTRQSGTAARLTESDRVAAVFVTAVLVTAPGITFTVHQGERAARPGVDPDLTVVCIWHTVDPVAAAKVLVDIGARPQPAAPDGELRFAAKNGGLVSLRAGEREGVDVDFEYTGDLPSLRDRVLNAGFPAVVAGRLLRVSLPSGKSLMITGPRNPSS